MLQINTWLLKFKFNIAVKYTDIPV